MTDIYKRNRVNQLAVTGAMSLPTGHLVLQDIHDLLVWWQPNAPEALWRIVVFVVAALGGAVIGKIVRTLEN